MAKLVLLAFLLFSGAAEAACSAGTPCLDSSTNAGASLGTPLTTISGYNQLVTVPSGTLTLPSTTTAYSASTLIASSGTAGSVVVPTLTVANSAGAFAISRLRLSTNDTVSTSWGAQRIQVDLWTAAPTFSNGDRGTWAVATGAGAHWASYTCTMSAVGGDGTYGECTANYGSPTLKLASGTTLYWTLEALTGSGVTGASKVFTLIAEEVN